jgi:metal transporter CNNM
MSALAAPRVARTGAHRHAMTTVRPAVLALARLLFVPLVSGAPIFSVLSHSDDDEAPADPSDPNLYLYLGIAIALVLLGGIFAGLTIALMGQDETYLQVIATSGEGSEKRYAARVLHLLAKGKHWVLVTLLLSNVITNETLPIVLDRSLGGGWPAVVTSTVLIVIFGEVVPQSICVRYGLSIGAYMAPIVTGLMWIMGPVAWPTAKLLDYLLGEDHGTMYKKAGLKTLVTLHKTLGTGAGEQLMEDEVTIINSVLDLKEKPVGGIMTPMQDVFTMSADTVLDEKMMDTILSQGYSRIPIYSPDNGRNFIGMLLVKILITYDPEDCKRVRDFALATLPETAPHTSCLDIINFFQEGKSHMVLVSDYPGQDKGALGVVTLEDVIEELIGEEIIDESDVFVDVHKAIRRMHPAPKTRWGKSGMFEDDAVHESHSDQDDGKEADENAPLIPKSGNDGKRPSLANGPQHATFMMRRKSSTASSRSRDAASVLAGGGNATAVPVRGSTTDLREHLKHLGPSNAASKPRATKYTSVKIKPGVGTIPENKSTTTGASTTKPADRTPQESPRPPSRLGRTSTMKSIPPASATTDHPAVDEALQTLRSDSRGASGGAAALYGTMNRTESPERGTEGDRVSPTSMTAQEATRIAEENTTVPPADGSKDDQKEDEELKVPQKIVVGAAGKETQNGGEDETQDRVGDLMTSSGTTDSSDPAGSKSDGKKKKKGSARSGSITQTTVESTGGMRKMVLEATSSSNESDTEAGKGGAAVADAATDGENTSPGPAGEGKKKRKKRGKKKKASD